MLMMLVQWLVTALALLAVSYILPGVHIASFGIALIAALIIGGVNLIVRPLITLITLPVNILTLGLFSFIINALMFALAAWMVPGFEVSNFLSALAGSILLALITGIFGSLVVNRTTHA